MMVDVIDFAVTKGLPLKIIVVSGLWVSRFEYRPDEKVFVKVIDHRDRYVCARWGFPAKCRECDEKCARHQRLPVAVVRALAHFWRLVSSDADETTAVVEWQRPLLREIPGAAVVRFL